MLLKTAFALASPGGKDGQFAILIFHRVLAEPDPLFPGEPDRQRFEEILRWLKSWFNVLPLEEGVQRLRRGDLPARAAAITFDDGYADNFENATPLLQKHGLHATFFVATGFLDGGRMWNDTIIESVRNAIVPELDAGFAGLGRLDINDIDGKRAALDKLIPAIKHLQPDMRETAVARVAEACQARLPNNLMMTSAQLRELRHCGMGIGAHTVSHPILARTDATTAHREISNSRDALQAILGERIGLFAYPNGKLGTDYDQSHADMVRSLGFDAAVSTNPGICHAGSNIYELPRFTPWDRGRWRFATRLLLNMRMGDTPHAATRQS